MASYLAPGLSIGAANGICMQQCKAMCCRGPLVLVLAAHEVPVFKELADKLSANLVLRDAADGGAHVRFTDHPGDHCPMLDDATSACRIYRDRPKRCRDFPERPTPGCAISGG